MSDIYFDGGELCISAGRNRISRCTHCGFEICDGDDASIVISNGDSIHRECWEEYASENADEFLKPIG